MNGIDVSHWNGKIDWREVKRENDFAIMKISQRFGKDPKFDKYYADARAAGFYNLGGYIFNDVKNVTEAREEARNGVEQIRGKDLPFGVWLDIEINTMKKLGRQNLTDILEAEAEIIRAAGFKVGIYCSRSWYLNVLDSAKLAKHFVFWVARYPTIDTGIIKESLSTLNLVGCGMWQYSSKGKAAGISGNVDLDITDADIQSMICFENASTFGNPYKVPTATLYRFKPLMKKQDVMWLQWWMAKHNKYSGNIDGSFGKLTDGALRNFQREYTPNCVDGKCGPKTRKALQEKRIVY